MYYVQDNRFANRPMVWVSEVSTYTDPKTNVERESIASASLILEARKYKKAEVLALDPTKKTAWPVNIVDGVLKKRKGFVTVNFADLPKTQALEWSEGRLAPIRWDDAK